MKLLKLLFTLICLYISRAQICAQILTIHGFDKAEKSFVAPYDSTKNFLFEENVTSYIGQILYVNGLSGSLQDYGYNNFKTIKEPRYDSDNRYGSPAKQSENNTKYEDLYGKYFIVKDVQRDSRASQGESVLLDEYFFGDTFWFLLENKEAPSDTVWYKYNGKYERRFPFIVLSYYNYIKNEYIGKTYISSYYKDDNDTLRERIGQIDFVTGEEIKAGTNHYWTCIDVIIEDKYFYLSLVFKDDQGQTVIKKVKDVDNQYLDTSNDIYFTIMEKSKYVTLCNKYGTEAMNKVRQHKVYIGMPEVLIKMSWGKPQKINRTSYGPDQWCYDNQYIYVENGKVSAWN